MIRLPKLIHIVFFLFVAGNAASQKITTLCSGQNNDSSFYHIARISQNEFWAGGEYGILLRIDSSGSIQNVSYPNEGGSILHIEKIGNRVFIATDNGVIYSCDLQTRIWLKRKFTEYKNKAFYNLVPLQNGQILVTGGATKVAHGGKAVPHGFISVVDTNLSEIINLWSSKNHFVWSAIQLENSDLLAATYNGRITKIKRSILGGKWKTIHRLKCLVHELADFGGKIWYSGARNFHVGRGGIIGNLDNHPRLYSNDTAGSIWSMVTFHFESKLGCSQNGMLVHTYMNCKCSETQKENISLPVSYPMYDMHWLNTHSLLVAGHGRTLFLVNWPYQ